MKLFLQVLFLLSATLTAFAQDNHADDNSVPRFDTLSIRAAIEQQMGAYPESTLQDIYKSFYQGMGLHAPAELQTV